MGFRRIEDLDEALSERIEREDLPCNSAFLALLTRDRPRHVDPLPSRRVISPN